jgi:exodeoxyribonuclease VII large subunit
MENQAISLFELQEMVAGTIREQFPVGYWVVAEISELRQNRSGHCYLELIEKEEKGEKLRAKARATIWAYTYNMLKAYFESTTGQALQTGLKVMVNVSVEFHTLYGYSLNIRDIDPAYTLGDLARQKAEVISKLEEDGVLEMNKALYLPVAIQRVAVISSETAAGYGDFIEQLTGNPLGFRFHVKLFQAVMQGDGAEQSIINALDVVFRQEEKYDVVVLIRGGGSQADLSCFNQYWLAFHLAQFSLPVLTGIGHERDDTVADLVAHTKLKTPTAVAEFIIDHNMQLDETLDEAYYRLLDLARDKINILEERIEQYASLLQAGIKYRLSREHERLAIGQENLYHRARAGIVAKTHDLKTYQGKLVASSRYYILSREKGLPYYQSQLQFAARQFVKAQDEKLKNMEKATTWLSPENVLKRGYSLTTRNGKIITSNEEVSAGDRIETRLARGKIHSRVEDGPGNGKKSG